MILGFARRGSLRSGGGRTGASAAPVWAYLLPQLHGWRAEVVGEVPARRQASLEGWLDEHGDRVLLLIGEAPPGVIAEALRRHLGAAVHAEASEARAVLEGTVLRRSVCLARPGEARTPAPPIAAPRNMDARDEGGRVALHLPPSVPAAGRSHPPGSRPRRVLARMARRIGIGRGVHATFDADGPFRGPLVITDCAPGAPPDGELFLPPPATDPFALPAWIESAGRAAGRDLAGASWQLVPPDGPGSRPAVFLATPRDGAQRLAVKVAQDPRSNPLLENEYHSLVAFAGLDDVEPGTFPAPIFLERHGPRAVIGETAIDGDPFRARSSGIARCPLAATTLDWLEEVAAASAQDADPAELGTAVSDVVDRFVRIHAPPLPVERALRRDVDTLASAGGVPTVFVHGNVRPRNLLVSSGERVALLGWQRADPRGIPIGDLLHFLRTFGAFGAERRGIRWTPRIFARQFLEETELSILLETRVLQHASRLGLPGEVVPALLRTNLAEQGVHGASGRGAAARVLELLVERAHKSPVWRRLGPSR